MFKFRIFFIFTLLAHIYAPTALAELYYNYNDYNGTASVSYCSNVLGAITIPSSVSRVVDKEIIYYNVTEINPVAFSGCTSLTSISMPSVKTIFWNAFQGCTSLTSVSMPSVESIDECAFYDCISLTSVSMPSVKSIEMAAFSGCTSLTSVSMPSAVSIGDDAFWGCRNLTSISMPLVESIGSSAFDECTSLTSVSMPSVKSIDEWTFCDCTNLTSVSMPSVKSIGKSAFHCCSSLTSVSMPSVKSIEQYAFYDCYSLLEITLPSSIESIESYAFPYSIKAITCNATTPPIGSDIGWFLQWDVYLIVPDGCIEAYRNTEYWKDFYIEENLSIAPSRDMCGGWGNIT